ncbi:hypothetical protein BC938DRAFT_481372 [Jimgerdemannia flammicorona]|uniref:Peptidase A2 domain-containing protein n=1 Tax=Jimgerdemannia flammicorona TaxID=994334 RepID=A0A433QWV9_9FUNG|nr:hypothetical protein BC938DRAFT_481372 [Jimgerdemannia flammicorona]
MSQHGRVIYRILNDESNNTVSASTQLAPNTDQRMEQIVRQQQARIQELEEEVRSRRSRRSAREHSQRSSDSRRSPSMTTRTSARPRIEVLEEEEAEDFWPSGPIEIPEEPKLEDPALIRARLEEMNETIHGEPVPTHESDGELATSERTMETRTQEGRSRWYSFWKKNYGNGEKYKELSAQIANFLEEGYLKCRQVLKRKPVRHDFMIFVANHLGGHFRDTDLNIALEISQYGGISVTSVQNNFFDYILKKFEWPEDKINNTKRMTAFIKKKNGEWFGAESIPKEYFDLEQPKGPQGSGSTAKPTKITTTDELIAATARVGQRRSANPGVIAQTIQRINDQRQQPWAQIMGQPTVIRTVREQPNPFLQVTPEASRNALPAGRVRQRLDENAAQQIAASRERARRENKNFELLRNVEGTKDTQSELDRALARLTRPAQASDRRRMAGAGGEPPRLPNNNGRNIPKMPTPRRQAGWAWELPDMPTEAEAFHLAGDCWVLSDSTEDPNGGTNYPRDDIYLRFLDLILRTMMAYQGQQGIGGVPGLPNDWKTGGLIGSQWAMEYGWSLYDVTYGINRPRQSRPTPISVSWPDRLYNDYKHDAPKFVIFLQSAMRKYVVKSSWGNLSDEDLKIFGAAILQYYENQDDHDTNPEHPPHNPPPPEEPVEAEGPVNLTLPGSIKIFDNIKPFTGNPMEVPAFIGQVDLAYVAAGYLVNYWADPKNPNEPVKSYSYRLVAAVGSRFQELAQEWLINDVLSKPMTDHSKPLSWMSYTDQQGERKGLRLLIHEKFFGAEQVTIIREELYNFPRSNAQSIHDMQHFNTQLELRMRIASLTDDTFTTQEKFILGKMPEWLPYHYRQNQMLTATPATTAQQVLDVCLNIFKGKFVAAVQEGTIKTNYNKGYWSRTRYPRSGPAAEEIQQEMPVEAFRRDRGGRRPMDIDDPQEDKPFHRKGTRKVEFRKKRRFFKTGRTKRVGRKTYEIEVDSEGEEERLGEEIQELHDEPSSEEDWEYQSDQEIEVIEQAPEVELLGKRTATGPIGQIWVTLKRNQETFKAKVDTAADENVISEEILERLQLRDQLQPEYRRFLGAGGTPIGVLGRIHQVKFKVGEQNYQINLTVLKGAGSASFLLGNKFLQENGWDILYSEKKILRKGVEIPASFAESRANIQEYQGKNTNRKTTRTSPKPKAENISQDLGNQLSLTPIGEYWERDEDKGCWNIPVNVQPLEEDSSLQPVTTRRKTQTRQTQLPASYQQAAPPLPATPRNQALRQGNPWNQVALAHSNPDKDGLYWDGRIRKADGTGQNCLITINLAASRTTVGSALAGASWKKVALKGIEGWKLRLNNGEIDRSNKMTMIVVGGIDFVENHLEIISPTNGRTGIKFRAPEARPWHRQSKSKVEVEETGEYVAQEREGTLRTEYPTKETVVEKDKEQYRRNWEEIPEREPGLQRHLTFKPSFQ